MNVMIDSDVYLLDIRYQQDEKYPLNKKFLNLIFTEQIDPYTSIFNLLEICGILSFNLSRTNLEKTFISFAATYNTTILFPSGSSGQFIQFDLIDIWEIITKKVAFLDSLIISVFEETTPIQHLVSWNARHFRNKTSGEVLPRKNS